MLYCDDNLYILRCYLKEESVDLVYLDPPFNSVQNCNAFFQETQFDVRIKVDETEKHSPTHGIDRRVMVNPAF